MRALTHSSAITSRWKVGPAAFANRSRAGVDGAGEQPDATEGSR